MLSTWEEKLDRTIPSASMSFFFLLCASCALVASNVVDCMCIKITDMSTHAMRMGIADTTNGAANDRCCDGRCRGMLLGVPQPGSGGRDGLATASGGREYSAPNRGLGSAGGDGDRGGTSRAQGVGPWTGDGAGLREEHGRE